MHSWQLVSHQRRLVVGHEFGLNKQVGSFCKIQWLPMVGVSQREWRTCQLAVH